MTHRYLAIVIEFESDDELAGFQLANIDAELCGLIAQAVEAGGVRVHRKTYRMSPHYYSPYTSPMTVDVRLPTSARWSDGTGGRNPEGGGRGAD